MATAIEIDASPSDDEGANDNYDSHQLGYNPRVQNGGYDPQLENVRMESIRKIKGRFQHIYQKYGKDFEGVGDEIDMQTGVIVVNNGHLQNMEHENDAGNGDALALSRTFEDDGDDEEDDEDDSSSSESEAESRAAPAEDSNSVSSENPELDFSWQDDTAASVTSPEQDGDARANPTNKQPPTPKNPSERRKGMDAVNVVDQTSRPSHDVASNDIFGSLPGLKDSMLALQTKYRKGQDMAPDDIQALGMSIATQLASFITGGKPSKKRKRQTMPARLDSSDSSRGRPRHRSHSPVEPIAPTPARSPGSKSLWAPQHRPKGRRRRKSDKKATEQPEDDSLMDSFVLQTIMHQSALEPDELQGPTTVRSCNNCKTTETTCWRKGPDSEDLCNNCGMYFYRYGFMREPRPPTPIEKPPSPEPENADPRHQYAPYSANTSRPHEGVNLHGLHFSVREDAQLIKLKEIDRLTWDQIAMEHPGRTPYALQCRYSKMLHGKPCEARDMLSSRGYKFYTDADGNTIAHQSGPFNEEEDDLLLKLREEDGLDWPSVALQLPGRTAEDVEQRYDELATEYLGQDQQEEVSNAKSKSKPKPKRKRRDRSASEQSTSRYTPAEDDLILKLREDDKMSWQEVAKQMPGRTLAAVQRRYSRDIGPYGRSRSSTPRGSPAPDEAPPRARKYTLEEDSTLMRLRDEEDLEWEQIAEHIPGRSASSLENRYYYKIRKDDSQASRRASSVAPQNERHARDSLPAFDLEAQLNDAQDALQPDEDTFTDAEDNLIVKLRELEALSWEQIAVAMPGRTVSAISCRYYQYLLPRKVPEVRKVEPALDPALQSTTQDLDESRDRDADARDLEPPAQVDELADSTKDGDQRTRTSAGQKSSHAKKRTSDAPAPGRSKAARRSDAPMLRRALQKNLNRRSESSLPAAEPSIDQSMLFDGGGDEDAVEDELSADHSSLAEQGLLPSAFPIETPDKPQGPDRGLRSGSKRKVTYQLTPMRKAGGPDPSCGPTPQDSGLYITPARYQAQSHPYFVTNAASPEAPPAEVVSEEKAQGKRSVAYSKPRTDDRTEDVAFEHGKRSSRKRRRAPETTRATRPEPTQLESAHDEAETESDDGEEETVGEYFTSRKKKKGANHAQKTFSGRKPAAAKKNNHHETDAAATSSRALSPDAEETEEEDIEMPDLGTDDDQPSSDSSEEEEDDDELRCKPRGRSPLFDPRDTIKEAQDKKGITAVAKAGDGNTMGDINADVDTSNIPPEDLVRPDISWTELNFMALKSRAPEPMYTREVYAFLEANFPFFRICKGHWRDSIRGNLSTRPEFAKSSDTNIKAAQWQLADPNQAAVVVAKGGKRGRCPTGVERPKKADEVKEKRGRGRPSNASKGLPLKRQTKRNYIPAAERRRMAAAAGEPEIGDPDVPGTAGAPTRDAAVSPASPAAQVLGGAREDQVDARTERPSTIPDSDAVDHSDPIEGVPGIHAEENADIKYEPEATPAAFTAPTAPAVPPSNNSSNRAFATSSVPTAQPDYVAAFSSGGLTPASVDIALDSSSPARTTTSRPPKATPATARSTLFRKIAPASSAKSSPALTHVARAESLRTPVGSDGSARRVVQTPVSVGEGRGDASEDELA